MTAKEEKQEIKNKLEYLGLDLDNVPKDVIEIKPLEYIVSKAYEDTAHKVYRYVDIKDIQILLTNKNRLDSLSERYKNAMPLVNYLIPKSEEDIR